MESVILKEMNSLLLPCNPASLFLNATEATCDTPNLQSGLICSILVYSRRIYPLEVSIVFKLKSNFKKL